MFHVRMSRPDRQRWADTETLADLGMAMADWLEGRIGSWPGYQPGYGPDDETKPLIPTLAAACRAGYVTTCSQPGHGPIRGYDGQLWEQRAAVDGCISQDNPVLQRLVSAAHSAGLIVIRHNGMHRRGDPYKKYTEVTRRAGEAVTAFGHAPTRGVLATQWPGIGKSAYRAVQGAVHLTLIDPAWGDRRVLWDALGRAAR